MSERRAAFSSSLRGFAGWRPDALVTPTQCVRVILIAGFLVTISVNLPGQLSWDSIYALHQLHVKLPLLYDPPMMNALLWFFNGIVPGPALFVTADVLLFFGSLLWIVKLRPASWWTVVVALFIVFSPLVLITQGTVWHDILFANLSVAGFVALIWAAHRWKRPVVRYTALGLSIVLLCSAALTRQNGIICLVVALIALALIARKFDPRAARRVALGATGAALVVLALFNVGFSLRDANASYGSGVRVVREYDIIGVISYDPNLDLSLLDHGDRKLDAMIRSQAKAFTPKHLVTSDYPQLWSLLENEPPSIISSAWWSIVEHHPLAYARIRLAIFHWMVAPPDISQCLPIFVGIGGNPEWVKQLGLPFGRRDQDRFLWGYGSRFLGSPVYSHTFYALVALALIVLLLARGAPTDLAVSAMLASGLLFGLSFFVISLSCAYRFMYFLDMATLAGLVYATLDVTSLRDAVVRRRQSWRKSVAAGNGVVPVKGGIDEERDVIRDVSSS